MMLSKALSFHMASEKLVLKADDALSTFELGEDDEDVLNEVCTEWLQVIFGLMSIS
jgi:hypothetical protein